MLFGMISKTAARKLAPKGSQWAALDGSRFYKVEHDRVFSIFPGSANKWFPSPHEPDHFDTTYFHKLTK